MQTLVPCLLPPLKLTHITHPSISQLAFLTLPTLQSPYKHSANSHTPSSRNMRSTVLTASVALTLLFTLLTLATPTLAKPGGGNTHTPDCGAPFCARGLIQGADRTGYSVRSRAWVVEMKSRREGVNGEDAGIVGEPHSKGIDGAEVGNKIRASDD